MLSPRFPRSTALPLQVLLSNLDVPIVRSVMPYRPSLTEHALDPFADSARRALNMGLSQRSLLRPAELRAFSHALLATLVTQYS